MHKLHEWIELLKVYFAAGLTFLFNIILSVKNLNKVLLILTIIYTLYKIREIHLRHKHNKNAKSKEHKE